MCPNDVLQREYYFKKQVHSMQHTARCMVQIVLYLLDWFIELNLALNNIVGTHTPSGRIYRVGCIFECNAKAQHQICRIVQFFFDFSA